MRARPGLIAAAVALAAFLAHAGSLAGGFVYDDHRFVEENPAIRTLADPARFLVDPATASAEAGVEPDVYRPLRTLDFAIDLAVFGKRPALFHLMNALLHAGNALLVLLLLRRMLPGVLPAAVLGALVFAVHPVTAESVAWVSSRGDLLALFLVLLALEVAARPGALRTAGATALVALGCLAKESAVIAFGLLPLRDLALPRGARPPARTTIVRTALLVAVAAGYFVLRANVMPQAPDRTFLAQTEFPGGSRTATARAMLAGVGWYAGALLWPVGFPFDHRLAVPVSWGEPEVVCGAGCLATLVVAGVLAARRGRGVLAFACLGSLVALVPVSNVIVPLKALVAERFLYPVLPCFAAGVGLAVAAAAARLPPRLLRTAAVAAGAALLWLAVLAWRRDVAWRDDLSLWTAVQREDPMNDNAYFGLGFERMKQGHLREAERALATLHEMRPDDGKLLVLEGDLAGTLYRAIEPVGPGLAEISDVRARQRWLLRTQVERYRLAILAWERVGLVRGRGSPELLRRTLARWRSAALLYGDLADARLANEGLARDDAKATGKPAWEQRAMRAALVSMVLDAGETRPAAGPRNPAREAEYLRVRAMVLTDVGIDPASTDDDVRRALLPLLEALSAERPDDREVLREIAALRARLPR